MGQRYVAKSPFVALFYRNRLFEAAPDPQGAIGGWIKTGKRSGTLWFHMVSTCFNMFQLRHRLMASYGILSLFCLRTLESRLPLRIAFLTLIPRHVLNQPLHIMKVSLWTAKKTSPTGRWPEYLHSFLAMPRYCAQDIAGQCVCPYVLQDHAQWNRHKPSIVGKAPREGRGIVVQDQQNPSTHLDSTVERGLARIVADLCFQLVLVVGIGTDPIGRLLRQLSQGGMTLQARHEIADRLQPSMRDKPQVECNSAIHVGNAFTRSQLVDKRKHTSFL